MSSDSMHIVLELDRKEAFQLKTDFKTFSSNCL